MNPEFSNAEAAYLARLPSMYQLLYREYQRLLRTTAQAQDNDSAQTLAQTLTLGLFLSQALASSELRSEDVMQAQRQLEQRREAIKVASPVPKLPALQLSTFQLQNLIGRLCFRLDEVCAVLLAFAPAHNRAQGSSTNPNAKNKRTAEVWEPLLRLVQSGAQYLTNGSLTAFDTLPHAEREAHSNSYFCYWTVRSDALDILGTSDTSESGSKSAQSERGRKPRQVESKAEPNSLLLFADLPPQPSAAKASTNELCLALSRLGHLQLSLHQKLRQRVQPLKREDVGQNDKTDSDNLLQQPHLLQAALEHCLQQKTVVQSRELLQECLTKLCQQRLLLISGGPGSGKTSLLASLLHILQAADQKVSDLISPSSLCSPNHKLEIALSAPTARAAQRMLDSLKTNADPAMASLQATTLHKLLQIGWSGTELYRPATAAARHFNKGGRHYQLLKLDILVVDEASMLDSEMAWQLLSRLHPQTRLILIGDPDQLPSIGLGAFWQEILHGLVPPDSRPIAEPHQLAPCLVQLQGSYRSVAEIQDLALLVRLSDGPSFWQKLQDSRVRLDENSDGISSGSDKPVQVLSLEIGAGISDGTRLSAAVAGPATAISQRQLLRYLWQNWCPHQSLGQNSGQNSDEGSQAVGFPSLEMLLSQLRAQKQPECLRQIAACFAWMQDSSILSPLQRSATGGARTINQQLLHYAQGLAPNRFSGGHGKQAFSQTAGVNFYHGCPIQINRNNYELQLYNGDRGFCFRFGRQYYAVFQASESNLLEGYRLVPMAQIADCEASFVQTIHKSQGSEYQRVCLLLPEFPPGPSADSFNPWSQALLYTAITRAKRQLCFVRLAGENSSQALQALAQVLEATAPPVSLLSQLLLQQVDLPVSE